MRHSQSTIVICAVLAAAMLLPACGLFSISAIAGPPPQPAVTQQVPLPYNFHDALGLDWPVQADGSIGAGTADVFDAGGRLFVGGPECYTASAPTVALDAAQNVLIFPAANMSGLSVSRWVGIDVKEGFARWVEILENSSATPVKTQVRLTFDMGTAPSWNQPVMDDQKHAKQIGLAVFDGMHAVGMVAAGRGTTMTPTFVVPPNGQQQVAFSWDVEVPAHRSIALVHLHVVRPSVKEASAFIGKNIESRALANLPPAITKIVVNFTAPSSMFGDIELLRGDLYDVVELVGGDQYKGTIEEPRFELLTSYGMVDLAAGQVLAMNNVGQFRPTQLLVTREGEAFGGILQTQVLHLRLSSGQRTAIPILSVKRMGYRRQAGDPERFQYAHPMLSLRGGDRIAVQLPTDPIAVSTRFGDLVLNPSDIAALVLADPEQPMHQLILKDGTTLAALFAAPSLALRPLTVGSLKPVNFSTSSIGRLQLVAKIEEPPAKSPMLALANGDRIVGSLSGTIALETAFDTLAIDGAEVARLKPSGTGPCEVQLTLWDDATVSGRLPGDVLSVELRDNLKLNVPASLIEEYTQPQPRAPASMVEKVRGLVAELGSDDWKRADRATMALGALGLKIAPTLGSMREGQSAQIQARIDRVLSELSPKSPAASGAAKPPVADDAAPAADPPPPGVQPPANDSRPPAPGS